jgi:nicotinamidase-related amidase
MPDQRSISGKAAPTLIIVDMQPKFPASNAPSVIKANQVLIRQFKRQKYPIIVLEYVARPWDKGGTSTHAALKKTLGKYKKVVFATKEHDDGSDVVKEICDGHGFGTDEFLISGVNLGACVADTAYGLHDLYPHAKICLVEEAVNGYIGEYQLEWIRHDIARMSRNNIIGVNLEYARAA